MDSVIHKGVVICGALLAGAGSAWASDCAKPAGRLVSLQGEVEARAASQTAWSVAQLHEKFCPGDALRTGPRSRAAVELSNETIVRLDQRTTLTLTGLEEKSSYWVDLLNGAAHFLSRTPRALKVKTPYVNAGVEGTEFVVRAENGEGSVTVVEGRVLAENQQGTVPLTSGKAITARNGQAPVMQSVVRLRDAVQWSLYYPPVFDAGALTGDAAWIVAARQSIAAATAGNLNKAFAAMASTPDVSDARFFNLRAGLLLSVGRVDEAQTAITRSLTLAPDNAHAVALQSVMALVGGESATALTLAQRATEKDSASAPAWIALSYAQQAAFNIEGARASTERAQQLSPDNVLVTARQAELLLSLGDLRRALSVAERAVALNPDSARTHTVLGFAHLTRIKAGAARLSFEKAIALDSADPLPRLGMGLAIIRSGKLEEGRREIEVAAALDPNNALIRSYLGKAYYEEKRNKLAAVQFDMARQLDPNDPTPWYYDAIRKQTENRPVEALDDLEKSIALNDHRAVYRSRLLLDQDLAARSASLGRIFNDLGFQKLALLQGWQSVATDPGDYSGHRLLADNYVSVPGQNIARVSELLKAQLLQPVSVTPVSPRMTETNPAVLDSAGATASSLNEYNPLFLRDHVGLQLGGLYGSNNTRAGDVLVSGVGGVYSFSAGKYDYTSDGWHPNNDRKEEDGNIFLQGALTPELNVQAEWRQRTLRNGDLAFNFDPGSYSSLNRRSNILESSRVGLHYSSARDSDVLVSWIGANIDHSQQLASQVPGIDQQITNRGSQGEAQYLWRGKQANITIGGGSYDIKEDNRSTYDWTGVFGFVCPPSPPFPPVVCSTQQVREREHREVYVYGNFVFPKSVLWTLGASLDSMREDVLDLKETNPKFGLQWSVMSGTQVRVAYFETVKRSLLVNQTIEPTQVAGFNQFFDETNGARAKVTGVGVDSVMAKWLYAGVEGVSRRIEVPQFVTGGSGTTVDFADDEQKSIRSYLYWVASTNIAITLEPQYESIENRAHTGPLNVSSTAVPAALRYFSPSGLLGKIIVTHVHQDIDFSTTSSGSDHFNVVDAGVGYRLPRRQGVIWVEARNLFDRKFFYQDLNFMSSEPLTPLYVPERQLFVRLGLNF